MGKNRFTVIGYPIKHSLSPWIHGQFLEREAIDGTYTITEIPPDNDFTEEIDKLKSKAYDGYNVTAPYKEKIIPLLDDLDPLAEKMGAVNTVVNKDGKWLGYNTDGVGYLRSLASTFQQQINKEDNVLILGAGGAARGIYFALDDAGFRSIDIANRTTKKALDIMEQGSAESNAISLRQAESALSKYQLIIQTTTVGMKPNTNQTIISLENLHQDAIVSDIVYQPLNTKFIQQAMEKGVSVHFGHTMLLYQAQFAFEIWTGIKASVKGMDGQLQQILEGR